jgi:toxin ParE1/3/4
MSFQVLLTDKANDQLNNIVNYIAGETQNIDIALNYLKKIEQSILELSEFPYIGVKPRYSILRKQGYRVLVIDRLLVFYKVKESSESVIIYAIFNEKQEYRNLI